MKVLFNATTLLKGGALQASSSFVSQTPSTRGKVEWYFALSKALDTELTPFRDCLRTSGVEVFHESPARSRTARKKLTALEQELQPDVVFTFFGPAYVRFRSPHLCGVADPWVTHSSVLAFRGLGLSLDQVRFLLLMLYKALWFRNADEWVVEAEVARQGLVRRLRVDPDLVRVVPNSCGPHYLLDRTCADPPGNTRKLRILTLSAYYKHKNLEIIPRVASEISKIRKELDFEFVLTLPQDDPGLLRIRSIAQHLMVADRINNVGPIPVAEGPALYESCHLCFLPSLLETSSANYPEAMAMGRPIVTTDLRFSRDVCGDAAEYYPAMEPAEAARSIVHLLDSPARWTELVSKGREVIRNLPTPARKFEMYMDQLSALANRRDLASRNLP